MKYQVLSIDAWGNQEEGYEWNNWHKVGFIDISTRDTEQDILEKMYINGFINNITGADIEDDQHNWVVVDKKTREPVFAIEYGSII